MKKLNHLYFSKSIGKFHLGEKQIWEHTDHKNDVPQSHETLAVLLDLRRGWTKSLVRWVSSHVLVGQMLSCSFLLLAVNIVSCLESFWNRAVPKSNKTNQYNSGSPFTIWEHRVANWLFANKEMVQKLWSLYYYFPSMESHLRCNPVICHSWEMWLR